MQEERIDEICSGGQWLGSTSEEIVGSIETVLGVRFPSDYRYFLLHYGSGNKKGVEIAGHHPKFISDQHVLGKTVYELRKYHFYPKHYIFISDTGDGGQVCMDIKTWSVNVLYQEPPRGIREIPFADNFTEFLIKSIATNG